jgi:hypothetical protein
VACEDRRNPQANPRQPNVCSNATMAQARPPFSAFGYIRNYIVTIVAETLAERFRVD